MKINEERLRELRGGKSQTEIAKAIGCAQKTYSQYELKQRDTSTDVLCQLADYYGVSTDYLLGRTEKRKPYPPTEED